MQGVIPKNYLNFVTILYNIAHSQKSKFLSSALITRVPAFVRPMVIGEVENYARSNGNSKVTREIVEAVKAKWADSMNYT